MLKIALESSSWVDVLSRRPTSVGTAIYQLITYHSTRFYWDCFRCKCHAPCLIVFHLEEENIQKLLALFFFLGSYHRVC